MTRKSRKSMAPNVFFILSSILCLISILAFISPLVLGLLVYYDVNGIGTEAAKYFVQKIGYDPTYNLQFEGATRDIDMYYSCLRILIGMGILTFTPISLYGIVIAICFILSFFGIEFREANDAVGLGVILGGLLAVAMAIVYWWRICQPVVAYSSTVMSAAGTPMHWGYRWMFYLFPLITFAIQAIATGLGTTILDKIGLDDILMFYPIASLFGVTIGGGLLALMCFAVAAILIVALPILGALAVIAVFLGLFAPSQAYYTDKTGATRKYHETFMGDAYIDENDAESWKDYKGY